MVNHHPIGMVVLPLQDMAVAVVVVEEEGTMVVGVLRCSRGMVAVHRDGTMVLHRDVDRIEDLSVEGHVVVVQIGVGRSRTKGRRRGLEMMVVYVDWFLMV